MSPTVPPPSQLSPHRAERIDLPGRDGPIAGLHVRTMATGHPAPIALLVPGYTGSKEDFVPLLDGIAEAGMDAIAVDLPGQYESDGPDEESAYLPSALGFMVAELIGKLTAEGHRVLLLGHSYGGLVARGAVLAGAPVSGLTLMSSGPAELPDGFRRQALDIGEPAMREQGIEAALALRELLDSQSPDWGTRPDSLKLFLRERFLRSMPAALLGMAHGLRTEPDLVNSLARLLRSSGTHCLVVCGEFDDAWSPAVQRDMAERLDADFAMIRSARHSPNTENPEGLLATLLPTWRTWLFA